MQTTPLALIENLGGGDLIGRVRWDVDAGGVSPVPEPGTWVLMIAGLGWLTVARRRRSLANASRRAMRRPRELRMPSIFRKMPIAAALLVAAGLFGHPASAAYVEAESVASVGRITFDFYGIDGHEPSVSFIDDSKRWRALTTAYFGDDGYSTPTYMSAYDTGSQHDAIFDPKGNASSRIDGTRLRARGRAVAPGAPGSTYFEAHAGVSSTATVSSDELGFYNMVLGAGTGVRLTTFATVETSLRDRCLVDCGFARASAGLYASFGPEDPDNPGVPMDRLTLSNYLDSLLDEGSITGSGGLLHDERADYLTLTFQNLTDGDLIGRVRWDATINGSAPVPEPAGAVLMIIGLAWLARRRYPGSAD